jgi:hypothetical protein
MGVYGQVPVPQLGGLYGRNRLEYWIKIDTCKLYETENTDNEKVLTLQTGDILVSALDPGGNLTLVLVAASRRRGVNCLAFNLEWRMQLGVHSGGAWKGVCSYIVARS